MFETQNSMYCLRLYNNMEEKTHTRLGKLPVNFLCYGRLGERDRKRGGMVRLYPLHGFTSGFSLLLLFFKKDHKQILQDINICLISEVHGWWRWSRGWDILLFLYV